MSSDWCGTFSTSLRSKLYFIGSSVPISSGTAVKIESFRVLPEGWHYGEGASIDEATINRALDIYWCMVLNNFTETDAFPGACGEVQLAAYNGARFVSVIIEPTGEFSLIHEVNGADVCEPFETSDLSVVKNFINDVARQVAGECRWSSFATFIQSTSIANEIVSLRLPSKNQVKMAAPHS